MPKKPVHFHKHSRAPPLNLGIGVKRFGQKRFILCGVLKHYWQSYGRQEGWVVGSLLVHVDGFLLCVYFSL